MLGKVEPALLNLLWLKEGRERMAFFSMYAFTFSCKTIYFRCHPEILKLIKLFAKQEWAPQHWMTICPTSWIILVNMKIGFIKDF